MDTSDIIIKTENLEIKGITLECKDDTFREFTSGITTYMFPKSPEKIEETIEHIKSSMKENKEGSDFNVVIFHKQSKEFLGRGGVHHIDKKTPELGIWIKKSAHGHNYGREAVVALKKWADSNLDYEYIIYPVDENNFASRKIPEFLGGKIEKKYNKISLSGRELHILEYKIYPPKK